MNGIRNQQNGYTTAEINQGQLLEGEVSNIKIHTNLLTSSNHTIVRYDTRFLKQLILFNYPLRVTNLAR